MKSYQKLSIVCITVFLVSFGITSISKAQDGFFSDAHTLGQNQFELGFQPVMLTEPNDFMMMFRGGYGFAPSLTGYAKVGALADETYLGAHLEYNVAYEPRSAFSVSLLGGAFDYYDVGLKLGVNISKDIQNVSIYTGMNYQPIFTDNTINALLIPVGADINIDSQDNVDLVLEADIPANDDAEFLEALTFGLNIRL